MSNIVVADIQKCSLETMKFFINFCNENHIRYFVAGGTLLGAVRHKGFIPWDDDIDIAVPREDYNRLLKLRDKIQYPYILRNALFDNEIRGYFSKLENIATTKVVDLGNGREYVGGLSIDIFPQDGMANSIIVQKLHVRMFEFILGRFIIPLDQRLQKRSNGDSLIMLKRKMISILEKLCSIYKYDYAEYARSFYGVYGKKETYLRSFFGEGTLLPFEDIQVRAPEKWNEYLSQMYGDYMMLPPCEKRCTSHVYKLIDLDHSYLELLKERLLHYGTKQK